MLIRAFGLSELTITAYPFFISILGCLLAYALARYIVAPLAGLIALALVAISPLDITTASLLLPDAIAAFWANVAVDALIGLNRSDIRHVSSLGLLSGVFFGISWLCKESVVYLVPFIILLVFVAEVQTSKVGRLTGLAAIGLGSLAVLFAEMIFHKHVTGDALFRLHATERNYVQAAVWFFDSSSPFFGWAPGATPRLC